MPTAASPGRKGYTLVMVLFAVFLLAIGMLVAMPVWETQIRRDMEEELIFRGGQYVEAIRVFQTRNPGRYPESLKQLFEENFLRRPFKDPMTDEGEWNVILIPDDATGAGGGARTRRAAPRRTRRPGRMTEGGGGGAGQQSPSGQSPDKVLVAPLSALESISNPRIIGVVSSSSRSSMRIFHDQTTYDHWLFFLGFKPGKMPEIEFYNSDDRENERP